MLSSESSLRCLSTTTLVAVSKDQTSSEIGAVLLDNVVVSVGSACKQVDGIMLGCSGSHAIVWKDSENDLLHKEQVPTFLNPSLFN